MAVMQFVETLPQPYTETGYDRDHDASRLMRRLAKPTDKTPIMADNLPEESVYYHKSFTEYLEICWNRHFGAVVSPDILWHILLTELTGMIAEAPEIYRPLFSRSEEKQEVQVITMELVTMPIDQLIETLEPFLPTESGLFLPEFSTTTDRSQHACRVAFADLVSPYYDYSMAACGIPALDVRGTEDDWERIGMVWDGLCTQLQKLALPEDHREYLLQVGRTLSRIWIGCRQTSTWRLMFDLACCGSGSDKVMRGWLTKLFRKQPELAYPSNFGPCVGTIKYRQVETEQDYRMYSGLLSCVREEEFLVPEFSYVVQNITQAEDATS